MNLTFINLFKTINHYLLNSNNSTNYLKKKKLILDLTLCGKCNDCRKTEYRIKSVSLSPFSTKFV